MQAFRGQHNHKEIPVQVFTSLDIKYKAHTLISDVREGKATTANVATVQFTGPA